MDEEEFWERFDRRITDRERIAVLEANYATMKTEVKELQAKVSWITGSAIITAFSAFGTMFTLWARGVH